MLCTGLALSHLGGCLQGICLKDFPEVIALQHNDEDVSQLSSLQPALLLERWLSHHLACSAAVAAAGAHSDTAAAQSSSSQLVQQYAALLRALDPTCCAPDAMR